MTTGAALVAVAHTPAIARWADRPITTTPASGGSILNVPIEDAVTGQPDRPGGYPQVIGVHAPYMVG